MDPELRLADAADLDMLVALVSAYHAFEGIRQTPDERGEAIRPLLEDDDVGRIWLIEVDSEVVGYIALSFGYSIEFAGRDAFLDEFFIKERFRGRGIGRRVLERVMAPAREFGVNALHLEVAKTNFSAQRLYASAGFEPRTKYQLMSRSLKND